MNAAAVDRAAAAAGPGDELCCSGTISTNANDGDDAMGRFLVLAGVFGLVFLPAAAGAQQSSHTEATPGIWYDITKTPLPQGGYGLGFTSTQRMLERCTALLWSIHSHGDDEVPKYSRNYQTGYCLGWINSAMAFLNFHDEAGEHTLGVCLPENVDSKAVIEAFVDYGENNREHLIYNPSLLIYWALLEKYPCKK